MAQNLHYSKMLSRKKKFLCKKVPYVEKDPSLKILRNQKADISKEAIQQIVALAKSDELYYCYIPQSCRGCAFTVYSLKQEDCLWCTISYQTISGRQQYCSNVADSIPATLLMEYLL